MISKFKENTYQENLEILKPKKEDLYTVGFLAHFCGCHEQTIRNLNNKKILPERWRYDNGIRVYTIQQIERVAFTYRNLTPGLLKYGHECFIKAMYPERFSVAELKVNVREVILEIRFPSLWKRIVEKKKITKEQAIYRIARDPFHYKIPGFFLFKKINVETGEFIDKKNDYVLKPLDNDEETVYNDMPMENENDNCVD